MALGGNLLNTAPFALCLSVIEGRDTRCGDAPRHDNVDGDAVFAYFASKRLRPTGGGARARLRSRGSERHPDAGGRRSRSTSRTGLRRPRRVQRRRRRQATKTHLPARRRPAAHRHAGTPSTWRYAGTSPSNARARSSCRDPGRTSRSPPAVLEPPWWPRRRARIIDVHRWVPSCVAHQRERGSWMGCARHDALDRRRLVGPQGFPKVTVPKIEPVLFIRDSGRDLDVSLAERRDGPVPPRARTRRCRGRTRLRLAVVRSSATGGQAQYIVYEPPASTGSAARSELDADTAQEDLGQAVQAGSPGRRARGRSIEDSASRRRTTPHEQVER